MGDTEENPIANDNVKMSGDTPEQARRPSVASMSDESEQGSVRRSSAGSDGTRGKSVFQKNTQVVVLDKGNSIVDTNGRSRPSGKGKVRRSTVVGLPPTNKEENGIRWELCMWMDGMAYQVVMTIALVIALFFSDTMELLTSNDDVDVAISAVLLITFILFSMDFILQCYARDGYVGSFFFYMDIVGTLSLVTEITWMAEPLGLSDLQEGTMMRASRTSRVGARAARMTRLLRLIKIVRVTQFLRYCLSAEAKETLSKAETQETTSLISVKLSESISKQVAALTLVTSLVAPLLAHDMKSGHVVYHNLLKTYVGKSYDEISPIAIQMEEEFSDSSQKVVSIQVGEELWTFRDMPAREKDSLDVHGGDVTVILDVQAEIDEMSAFNIGLEIFVIVMLLFFSTTINAVCNELVIAPLERMLTSLQDTASQLFSALEVEVTEEGELEELGTMETILKKLTRLVHHLGSSGDQGDHKLQQILEDKNLDTTSRNYMLDMTHKLSHNSSAAQPSEESSAGAGGNAGASDADMDDEGVFPADIDQEDLDSWGMDTLSMPDEHAFAYVYLMFKKLNLIAPHLVTPTALRKLLEAIRRLMPPNPYHNFAHVIDVTHTVYRMASLTLHTTRLTELERMALMVAALAHDLGHPGQNNMFLIQSKDPLAVMYNDMAVLENSHAATLYQILEKNPEANVLSNLDETSWRDIRKMIVGMILHTDMSKHFSFVSQLEVLLELKGDMLTVGDDNAAGQLWDSDNRQTLLNMLLHSADISNPCKPWEVSLKWTDAVMGEFFAQGDLERKRGMKVSPMCDRATTTTPISQVNFIEFVVAPLWACVTRLLPPTATLFEHLLENRQTWGLKAIEDIMANQDKSEAEKKEEAEKMRGRSETFFKKNNPIIFGPDEDEA